MGFNFPNSPSPGNTYTPVNGPTFTWDGIAWKAVTQGVPTTVFVGDTAPVSPALGQMWWDSDSGNLFIWYSDGDSAQWVQVNGTPGGYQTAQTRNRIVNPAMQISQENGLAGSAVVASASFYPADQWPVSWVLTGTASTLQSTGSPTSSGRHITFSISTATASPAAAAYAQFQQPIEGVNIADFKWGTAQAKQVVFTFSCITNAPGTYAAHLKNATPDRTFLAPFTVTTSGVWQTFTIVVPGDTTGTWATGNGVGMYVGFGLVTGTTYGGGVAGWQAGNKIQIAGNTNLAATAGNYFAIGDVGLYLDPLNTGAAPPFVMPDEVEEVRACQRYWEVISSGLIGTGHAVSASSVYIGVRFTTQKRTAPALGHSGLAGMTAYNAAGVSVSIVSHGGTVAQSVSGAMPYYNTGGAVSVGQGTELIGSPGCGVILNARM